jgi:hypothetical protein
MRPRLPHAVAAMLAAGAVPVVLAQVAEPGRDAAPPAAPVADAPPAASQGSAVPLPQPPASQGSAVSLPQPPASQGSAVSLPQPPANLVSEPVASASRTEGADADLAKAIVDALIADSSMKHSKITVQPGDGGVITLTGVTLTRAQAKRAAEIATAHAGEGKVSNAIQAEEV